MSSEVNPPAHASRLVTFRNAFISGALLLAPLIVTILAFKWVIDAVGGTFRPFYLAHLPDALQQIPFLWDFVATLIVILLVTALGFLSNYVFGKVFLGMAERAIQRIPAVGGLYNSVKQIVGTFRSQNRNLFSKTVLVEFPRDGNWVLGFLTNKQQGEPHSRISPETLTLFIPTAPNPTSGFLIMVPREKVTELEMPVGDAMKMIVSGGAVIPSWPAPKNAELP
jgi:Uncharacterized conserved protein